MYQACPLQIVPILSLRDALVEATGGLLSVASIVGIAVGSGVLLCLLAVSMCYRLKRRAASESPSSLPDINSEVPREVPGERGAIAYI